MIQKHATLLITFRALLLTVSEATTLSDNLILVSSNSPVSSHWVDIILLYFIFLMIWDGLCFKEQAQSFSRHINCHSSFRTGTYDTNSSWFPRKLTACAQNIWEVWSCKTMLEEIHFTPNIYIIQFQASLEIF